MFIPLVYHSGKSSKVNSSNKPAYVKHYYSSINLNLPGKNPYVASRIREWAVVNYAGIEINNTRYFYSVYNKYSGSFFKWYW